MPPQKPLLTSRLATCVNRFHLYIAIQIRLSRSHRRADVVRSGTKINDFRLWVCHLIYPLTCLGSQPYRDRIWGIVVAAVPGSVTNHCPYKPATISVCYVPSVQWRVVTWCLAATMLLILQGCSGVLKAADEQTPAILGAAPAIQEPELDMPSVEISIPENVQEVSEEKEPETPAMIPTLLPSRMEAGLASWYGAKHHGKRTANGERFDQKKLTAAHPTLPWGSIVKVTSLANGKSVNVRINDRGPFIKDRIIDLSRAAARTLGMAGLMQVQLELLTPIETPEYREVIQDEQRQATAPASNQN